MGRALTWEHRRYVCEEERRENARPQRAVEIDLKKEHDENKDIGKTARRPDVRP